MPSITFDRFEIGLDRRKGPSVADANRMVELTNAYVTTGRAIKKRPGMKKIATLEPGTVGLVPAGGRLNTFYGGNAEIVHANTLFKANRLRHPSSTTEQPHKIHYAGVFLGYMYLCVEFTDGVIKHVYLDDPGAWQASTAYTLGTFKRPTTANGYRYEVTTAGTSGATEPTWPTAPGSTVTDGTVTWTCRGFEVTDTNCPHSKGVIRAAQHIFAINGDVVSFSAAGNPRDWTTSGDAGFLPVGLNQDGGSVTTTALGQFQNQLVVFFSDSAQIWNVSVDPANNSIAQKIYGVGTSWPRSLASFATDVFFLAYPGFRSITVNSQTENMQDTDVGSPIDSLVAPVSPTADVKAIYVPGFGQYWCFIDQTAWVYSFSKSSKIAAWSRYDISFAVDDVATLENRLYLRSGNDVYEADPKSFADDGQPFDVVVEMPFVDSKTPGILKQYIGFDVVTSGRCNVQFRFKANDTSYITDPIEVSGDTRPNELIPMELLSTAVAPRFTQKLNEDFRLDLITLVYNDLGQV